MIPNILRTWKLILWLFWWLLSERLTSLTRLRTNYISDKLSPHEPSRKQSQPDTGLTICVMQLCVMFTWDNLPDDLSRCRYPTLFESKSETDLLNVSKNWTFSLVLLKLSVLHMLPYFSKWNVGLFIHLSVCCDFFFCLSWFIQFLLISILYLFYSFLMLSKSLFYISYISFISWRTLKCVI